MRRDIDRHAVIAGLEGYAEKIAKTRELRIAEEGFVETDEDVFRREDATGIGERAVIFAALDILRVPQRRRELLDGGTGEHVQPLRHAQMRIEPVDRIAHEEDEPGARKLRCDRAEALFRQQRISRRDLAEDAAVFRNGILEIGAIGAFVPDHPDAGLEDFEPLARRPALSVAGAEILFYLQMELDKLLVLGIGGPKLAGLYAIIMRLVDLTAIPMRTFNMMLAACESHGHEYTIITKNDIVIPPNIEHDFI